MKLNEAFEVHDTLNPKIWNTKTNLLRNDVRQKVIEIVDEFEEYIGVPVNIVDVHLVGSNASYNYTDTSDLDVHVIANFEAVSTDVNVLGQLYLAKKTSFNSKYDIKIHGVEIELYIQDIKSSTASNGIYSVCDNKWIKEPKPIKSVTKHNTEKEVAKWKNKIKSVISSKNKDDIQDVINALYLMRHNSIAIDGEYGKGNQIFKDIRSLGLMDELKVALDDATSKELSLESFNALNIGELLKD